MQKILFGALVGAAGLTLLSTSALAEDAPPPVDKLIQQLGSGERDARRESAYQLSRVGPAGKEAVPALLKALKDEDKQVWTFSLAALAAIGPDAAEAVAALIAELDTKQGRGGRDRDRRQLVMRIAYALNRIGPVAIPPLIEALGQDDPGLRGGAARALSGFGSKAKDAVPALIKVLPDGREPVNDEVVVALSQIGPDAGPALVAALEDPEALRRAGAARALAIMDPSFRAAAGPVEKRLGTETVPNVRMALFTALPKVGVPPERCAALLVPVVLNEEDTMRHAALNALLSTRATRVAAVPKLAAGLKDPNPNARERAAKALGRTGADATSALPALLEATRQAGGKSVYADALAEIGQPALPVLLAALQKGKPGESAWVLPALRGFGAPAVPVLLEALKNPVPATRAAAANGLGSMGRDAADAVNPLFVLTEDATPGVQAAALRALVALRADSGRLKPLLQTALASKNTDVRKAGAAGTAALGGAAQLGVSGLLDLLADDDAAGRLAAVQALGQLGAEAAPGVPPLMAKIDDPALQSSIFETLTKIGPAAAPAVPKLLEIAGTGEKRTSILPVLTGIGKGATAALPMINGALKDSSSDVRASAVTALGSVESDEAKIIAAVVPTVRVGENGKVRRAAAAVLAKHGPAGSAAVPGLVSMLERETERSEGLKALKAIGVKTMPELMAMLAIKDPKVRTVACENLGALGPAAKDAAPKLREVLGQDGSLKGPINAALAKIEAAPAPTAPAPAQ